MAMLIHQVVKFVIFAAFMADQSMVWAHRTSHTHAQEWAKTVVLGKERTTTLQFYFHDTVSGRNPSAILVAQPLKPKYKTTTGFGVVTMIDDPLTAGPGPKSKLVWQGPRSLWISWLG
uniref:Dirigent protein n=1 Tax=Chenopodium quinoa TaxID=63459 RepID=A0A803LGH1_CHEQI